MAAAVNAIATGGELLQPRLVKGWISNGVYTATQKTVVRRVLSTATATQMTTIMEDVVERGTAKGAQVEGFTIAGKTGTAAKVLEGGRGYSSSDYNVSFAGFVPSRNPRFTILVVIDSPHAVSAYGGTVSAPVFQKIAAAALRHGGVPPTLNPPAPLIIERPDSRQQMVSGPAEPPVVTVADETSDSPVVFPNLVGMNARDAVRMMVRLGLSPKLYGAGHVVNQRPAAGSSLDRVNTPALWLDRRLPADVSSGEAPPRSFNADGVARGRP
jgi:membrane peptidoglycan carboxypeptidase